MKFKKSKAEVAATRVANMATKKANDFYEYHKDVIDEYDRLEKLASEAMHRSMMIRLTSIEQQENLPF